MVHINSCKVNTVKMNLMITTTKNIIYNFPLIVHLVLVPQEKAVMMVMKGMVMMVLTL